MNLSVIVPALNEGARIGRCLQALRAEFAGDLQVIDGGSTDDTVAQARAHGARTWSTTAGLARQCNFGAEKAQGDCYFFVAADSVAGRGWLAALEEAFRFPYVVYAGFQLALDDAHPVFRWIEWGGNVRSRLISAALPDQGLAVRRRSYWQVDGMTDASIIPYLSLCEGLRGVGEFRLLAPAMLSSARKWKEKGVWQTSWKHFQIYREHRGRARR